MTRSRWSSTGAAAWVYGGSLRLFEVSDVRSLTTHKCWGQLLSLLYMLAVSKKSSVCIGAEGGGEDHDAAG